MAINKNTSRKDYPIRCKHYKPNFVDNMQLIPEAKCEGVFYCKDKDTFKTYYNLELPGKPLQTTGKIITQDHVPTLIADSFVQYGNHLWLVTGIEIEDNNNEKRFTSRPGAKTTISLRR